MNRHAFRLTQRCGFDYGCDTRGRGPFIPLVDAEVSRLLPRFRRHCRRYGSWERGGLTVDEAQRNLLAASEAPAPAGHVFALEAESHDEGSMPALERLLDGWAEQGHEIVPLRTLAEALDPKALPHHVVDLPPPGTKRAVAALQALLFSHESYTRTHRTTELGWQLKHSSIFPCPARAER